MKTPLEIYKALDKEFCMGSPNSLVNRKCKTRNELIVYAMEEYAKQYHQAKLKLLGIAGVVNRRELLSCDCPECGKEMTSQLVKHHHCKECNEHYTTT